MSDSLNQIDFTEVPGDKHEPELTVYSLSTCAFCRKSMQYLEDNGFSYRYCHLDQLDFDLKREVKKTLKSKYENIPVFPVLVINDEEAISGFVEAKWAKRLGIE